jgi:hypothetical protein
MATSFADMGRNIAAGLGIRWCTDQNDDAFHFSCSEDFLITWLGKSFDNLLTYNGSLVDQILRLWYSRVSSAYRPIDVLSKRADHYPVLLEGPPCVLACHIHGTHI